MNNTTVRSRGANLESILSNVYYQVNIWFGLFLLINGNISCIVNIIVYQSQAFRKRACFIYLFWESVANFFFFNCVLVTRILQSGFQIPVMQRFDVICKIREFLSEYMYETGNMFFVLATLDRVLSAQRSIRLRQWSNRVSLANKLVLGGSLLWLFVVGHRLIFYSNSTGTCTSQAGPYTIFDTYLEAILSGVYSPLVVIVVAILLLQSVRSVTKRRVTPNSIVPLTSVANQSHLRQVDLQLTTMLFLQSSVAIITYVPYAIQLLYVNMTDGWFKSSLRQAWEQLIISIIRLCSYLFAASGFYISMISNRGFRKEFIRSFGINRITNVVEPKNTLILNVRYVN